jgi:hypothetical protein
MKAFDQTGNPEYTGLLAFHSYDYLRAFSEKAMTAGLSLGAEYNKSEMTFRFPSGSRVLLRVINSKEDAYKVAGMIFQYIGLTKFIDDFSKMYLQARLRSPRNEQELVFEAI